MKCGMITVKYFIFILNLPIVLLGIAIIVLGGFAMKKVESLHGLVDTAADRFALGMIVFGIVASLISFFGCCGAIKENRCMILTYAILLILIVILNLALVVLGFMIRDMMKSRDVHDALMDSFKKHNGTNETKSPFDRYQETLKCCGVEGAKDWGANIPESCCRKKPEGDKKCSDDDLFKDGCWTSIKLLADAFIISGIIGIVIMLILIALIVFVCLLAFAVGNQEGAS